MTDWSDLSPYRERLDLLDAQIMHLFGQRYAVRREVAAVKKACGLPVIDPIRAEAVIAKAMENAKAENVPADFAEALYRLVIDYSHRFESDLV